MRKRTVAVVVSIALATTSCATTTRAAPQTSQSPMPGSTDQALLADYLQRLPVGSRVHLERWRGRPVNGTLMLATADAVAIQENSQTPQPPVTIPLADVARVTLDRGHSTALKIWAGVGIALTGLYVVSALLIVAAASSAR
jgi:hypothetical protein